MRNTDGREKATSGCVGKEVIERSERKAFREDVTRRVTWTLERDTRKADVSLVAKIKPRTFPGMSRYTCAEIAFSTAILSCSVPAYGGGGQDKTIFYFALIRKSTSNDV